MFNSNTNIQNYTGIAWPYPVDYNKVNYVDCDFLIIGGGVAGCAAAMEAAKRGMKVAIVDKGPLIRSGSAGSGIDHWHDVATNPRSKKTPEEIVDWVENTPYWGGPYAMLHARYIFAKESYASLLDLEKLGMNIRDDGEFEGAPFVDPETGLMYAYDYNNCVIVRLKGGATLKPLMKAEVDRLGVSGYEYISVGHLLTEDGKTGPDAKVIGAVGFSGRTGECYVFRSKATLIATGGPSGYWSYSSEYNGTGSKQLDPNRVGEGHSMMAEIGVKLAMVERTAQTVANSAFRWPPYGVGDCNNTWYGCPIVDATGKQIPWTQNGKVMNNEDIYYKNTWPGLGDKGAETSGGLFELPQDMPERIRNGEFKLPFYADLTSLDPHERRVLWGLMIGNEGKTNYSVYKIYNANGFDPDQDMLQVPVMMPESYEPRRSKPFWNGEVYDPWRECHGCGNLPIVDWDLMTTAKGLFAAGDAIGLCHAAAAYTTGWYAGRNATKYIKGLGDEELAPVNEEQLNVWKKLIYAPITRKDGIGWKEFKAGCAKVMQGCCGKYLSEEVLKNGLEWFDSIENAEFQMLYARNPHELMRAQECYTQLFMSKLTLRASMARKSSSDELPFYRIDHPEKVKPEDDKYITITMENGDYVIDEMPLKYYLQAPYAPTYAENYEKHCAFDA